MAISIVKFREEKAYGVYEFLCDFDSDVKNLRTDCAPGSKAQVAESGKNYVFNSLKQWKEIESSGGSSGSGAGTTITSGVVNQDGTITFTDSNGNTFITMGESVIGDDGRDWVPTEQELNDIAQRALNYLPDAEKEVF